jgi:hypothetical protein
MILTSSVFDRQSLIPFQLILGVIYTSIGEALVPYYGGAAVQNVV